MPRVRRAVAVCTGVGLFLWGIFFLAVFTTPREYGANIGAGSIALVALALSVVAASFVIASTDLTARKAPGVASICAPVLWIALGNSGAVGRTPMLVLAVVPLALLGCCLSLLSGGRRHRLTTAARADRIVVLGRGRVVESGTHDDLLAAGGAYAELWASYADRPIENTPPPAS